MALAWAHFTPAVRERVRVRYLACIAAWKAQAGYRIPAEFVIVTAAQATGGGSFERA